MAVMPSKKGSSPQGVLLGLRYVPTSEIPKIDKANQNPKIGIHAKRCTQLIYLVEDTQEAKPCSQLYLHAKRPLSAIMIKFEVLSERDNLETRSVSMRSRAERRSDLYKAAGTQLAHEWLYGLLQNTNTTKEEYFRTTKSVMVVNVRKVRPGILLPVVKSMMAEVIINPGSNQQTPPNMTCKYAYKKRVALVSCKISSVMQMPEMTNLPEYAKGCLPF
eukprot:g52726.t1